MKHAMSCLACAAMALSFAPTAPVAAKGNDKPNGRDVAEFCKQFFDTPARGNFNLGGCIAFNLTDDPVSICQDVKRSGRLEQFGFKSQGECITYLKSLGA